MVLVPLPAARRAGWSMCRAHRLPPPCPKKPHVAVSSLLGREWGEQLPNAVLFASRHLGRQGSSRVYCRCTCTGEFVHYLLRRPGAPPVGGTPGGGELEPSSTPAVPPTLALRQRSWGGNGAGWSERTWVQTRPAGGDVYVRSGVAGTIGAGTSGVHGCLGAVGRPDRPIGVPE